MKTVLIAQAVEKLQSLCARTALPEQAVTDNGPQFSSDEFQEFIRKMAPDISLLHPTI